MCKLLKETLKSGRKNPQFWEGSKSENSWKYEAWGLFPSKLPNHFHLCVYLYYGEGTKETKAMPQWLRAGHWLLQASRPFLTSYFKTSLIMLNLRQKQTALLGDNGYSSVIPHTQSTRPPPSALSGFTYHSEKRGKKISHKRFFLSTILAAQKTGQPL